MDFFWINIYLFIYLYQYSTCRNATWGNVTWGNATLPQSSLFSNWVLVRKIAFVEFIYMSILYQYAWKILINIFNNSTSSTLSCPQLGQYLVYITWEIKNNIIFSCYHYFPLKPLIRENRKWSKGGVESGSLCMLAHGLTSTIEPGSMFFIDNIPQFSKGSLIFIN